jgi:hypothetical protein
MGQKNGSTITIRALKDIKRVFVSQIIKSDGRIRMLAFCWQYIALFGLCPDQGRCFLLFVCKSKTDCWPGWI